MFRIILGKTRLLRSLTAVKKSLVEGNHEDSVFGCSAVDLALNWDEISRYFHFKEQSGYYVICLKWFCPCSFVV